MLDPRLAAFVGLAALLVISPGATIVVITETAIEDGRRAALWTVVGVAIANSTLALASAFGLSAVFRHLPWTLDAVTIGGSGYLAFLGARGLWRAAAGHLKEVAGPARPSFGPTGRGGVEAHGRHYLAAMGKGITTNLLNPSVALFYTTVVPQFIGPHDPVLTRFVLLCAIHVGLAAAWHVIYAFSLGTVSERLTRPSVKRWMEAVTGVVLLGLGLRLLAGLGR
jgi:threonine/homoserine/homoserine lactone efflux protein